MVMIQPTSVDSRGPLARRRCLPIGSAAVAIIVATAVLRPAAVPQEPARAQPPDAAKQRSAAEKPAAKAAVEKTALAQPAAAAKPGNDEAARAELTTAAKLLFRQMFLTELRFIRIASGATEDQARRMAGEAVRPFRTVVTEFVARQLKARQDGKPKPAGQPDANAAYRSVHESLASIARAQLSAEQWARYRAQVEKRDAHRKQVAVRNLLVKLEQELGLTAEQRDRLGESLSTHWTPRWETQGIYLDDDKIFPEIPDPVVVPFLTERQKTAWKALEKGFQEWNVALDLLVVLGAGDQPRDDFNPDEPAGTGPAPKR